VTAAQVAAKHQAEQAKRATEATARAVASWRRVQASDLDGTWSAIAPLVTAVIVRLQREAAAAADAYHRAVVEAQGVKPKPAAAVNPLRFAGIASDGRDLDTLLLSPLIATQLLLDDQTPPPEALRRGSLTLGLIAGQQVRDAGRIADGVATAADQTIGGYIRYLNLPSCDRCVVLAGKFYRWNQGFERHPGCDCIHVAVPSDAKQSQAWLDRQDPGELVKQGNVTGLSQADRQAIDDGADVYQVINAHRGMSTAQVYGRRVKVTREGVTRRGLAGRRLGDFGKRPGGTYQSSRTPRLMPESIYKVASDREEALWLLKRFGYLI
jgi:hypothetical protein